MASRHSGAGSPEVFRAGQGFLQKSEIWSMKSAWPIPCGAFRGFNSKLLKLGVEMAQSTAKYMLKGRYSPSQSWKTFIGNHAEGIASVDFFVAPTAAFGLLYAFVILGHDRRRRRLVYITVTASATADWAAQQISETFPWNTAPSTLSAIAMAVMGKRSNG